MMTLPFVSVKAHQTGKWPFAAISPCGQTLFPNSVTVRHTDDAVIGQLEADQAHENVDDGIEGLRLDDLDQLHA